MYLYRIPYCHLSYHHYYCHHYQNKYRQQLTPIKLLFSRKNCCELVMQHMLCPGYVNCVLNINDTSISFDTYVCKI